MKLERNIGDGWRIVIPKEMRIEMNLKPAQKLTMESFPDNNEIILFFEKNESESILDNQKDKKECPSSRLNEIPNKFNKGHKETLVISKIKEVDNDNVEIEIIPEKKFKRNDTIEFIKIKPIEQQTDEELTQVDICPYDDNLVEPNSYIKINGKRICTNCINDLKQQLKDEIINKK